MSVSGYGGQPLAKVLEDFEKAEIKQVQLSVGAPGAADLWSYIDLGFAFIPHHNAPVNGKSNPINLCESLPEAFLHELFKFCNQAKSPHYTVHGGSFDPQKTTKREAESIFLENFTKLYQLGETYGVKVGVETMYPTSKGAQHILASEVDLYRMGFKTDMPLYRIADMAHLNIMRHAGNCKRDFPHYLVHHAKTIEIHVSENDGKNDIHQPITKDSWFWEIVKERPDLPVVIEGRLNGLGYETLRDNYQMALEILYG